MNQITRLQNRVKGSSYCLPVHTDHVTDLKTATCIYVTPDIYTILLPQRGGEDREDLGGLAFAASHHATRHGLGVGTSRHLHGLGYGTSCGDYVNLGLGNIGVWGLFKLAELCPGICFCLRAHVHE